MKQEAFVLQNRGMNRDTSISKAENSSAFENHNIRVLARDHDTLLSVTNERGNKEIVLNGVIVGTLIGWNVLNNHIILFTHDETEGVKNPDYIYRIDYVDGNFIMARGDTDSGNDSYRGQIDMRITEDTALHRSNEEKTLFRVTEGNLAGNPLFNGNLNFSVKNPIESVVYYETESIQKIYWVDGRNVLRFMNFMADIETVTTKWAGDNTYFDSNRAVDFMVNVDVEKTNSGNQRPNGVVQYLLTYYNKYGQESGYVWVSDLIYLAPFGHGGSADSYNNNSVTLKFSFLYEDFEYFRVYSIFRSSLNGQTTAYLIYDGKTQGGEAIVTDDGSSEEAVDSSRLLYLGSKSVHAGTIAHKDQTLFLGDLQSVGNNYNSVLETAIKNNMFITQGQSEEGFIDGVTWESACVVFKYTSSKNLDNPECDIPYVKDSGIYPYQNQTLYSSSQISTFKGGEKYRFAVVFRTANGVSSEAFWIGDAVNPLYPVIDPDGTIHRVVAECHIPKEVVATLQSTDYVTAQLMVAQATYADRSIKAQGILNPTMFNVWERYNDRQYAYPSWIFRPRGSSFAYKHFEPVHKSTTTEGEIECSYWETQGYPTPYYQLQNISTNPDYVDLFDGVSDYSYIKVLYKIRCIHRFGAFLDYFQGQAIVFKVIFTGDPYEALQKLNELTLDEGKWDDITGGAYNAHFEYSDHPELYTIEISISDTFQGEGTKGKQKEDLWAQLEDYLSEEEAIYKDFRVDKSQFIGWTDIAENSKKRWHCFNSTTTTTSTNVPTVFNACKFLSVTGNVVDGLGLYVPAYYRKHLMFVDENVVTFNSPEISYEAVSFDNADFKLRIIGAVKITGNISDYTVNAVPGKLSGDNLLTQTFNTMNESGKPDGLITWPLWREYELIARTEEETSGDDYTQKEDVKQRTSYDYVWGGGVSYYWLNMWKHSGKINGFTDYQEYDYSTLRSKTFANLRYSYWTIYNNRGSGQLVYDLDSLRMIPYTSSQYVQLGIGKDDDLKIVHYNGYVNTSLSVPNGWEYPIGYSSYVPLSTEKTLYTNEPKLFTNVPVPLTYGSNSHVVLSLHTELIGNKKIYNQFILPYMFEGSELSNVPQSGTGRTDDKSGALAPWLDTKSHTSGYEYRDYTVEEEKFELTGYNSDVIQEGDRYLLVGEIFDDYSGKEDTRYGGITSAAVNSNTFNVAGPIALIRQMNPSVNSDANILIGNQADTFFQRWDCLKTVPLSSDNTNNVIDILSCMLETHINIDGRTDLQRGINKIASINTETFGQLNPVYSQGNNFFANMDLDSKYNLDAYRSTITWSMQKADAADVDEWSHVTLANTLNLDGDKGFCRALRRFQNSIIAFQDRGISEVLFNSRTQVSTTDGVPIEIANSGKVDGKRYISNKYGCLNKWSITEGKSGLYFVDNINKTFALIGNQGVEPLSTRLHFDVWFREKNNMEPWNPKDFNNFVSFYDKVHSDIYLVKDNTNDDQSCLVYSELLGSFTSFYDYASVPMMVNVEDRFVSFRDDKLWLQNEGLYCNFFGDQYDFWVQYRVTPDPYGDKIWSTLEYRSDFFRVLSAGGASSVDEGELIDGGQYYNGLLINGDYQPDMTFDKLNVWNEYQNAQEINPWLKNKDKYPDVRKKFRIWRMDIPRAVINRTNKYGLDRIRNPWVNIKLTKDLSSETALATGYNRCMMQMHDVIVRYFGEL